ncbi:hypothetical protein QBC37DRAFT_374736 [Rhypophila decipiens]|uniref:Uncharacterized protein n=1 Tax=Rhypophila decipiens TaxID=261697 RepID=A0AAN7B7D2_9PEZI|nr:hypothetical protein QBC37DRAFT_374736 [Rhypophila decipiens]
MTMLQQGPSDQPSMGEQIFSDGKVGFSAEPVLHTSDDIAIPTVWVTTVPAPTGPNSSDGTLLSITAVVVLWAMVLIIVWAQLIAIAVWLCCFSRRGREMWRALWGWVCNSMLRFFMWARFLDTRA